MYGFYLIQANFSAKKFKYFFVQSLEKQVKACHSVTWNERNFFAEKSIKNVLYKHVFGIYGYICAVI